MRSSNSNYSLQRDFSKLESKLEVLDSRNKSGTRNKNNDIGYSKLDNKENHQIQSSKNQKYSYGAKYQQKLDLLKSKVDHKVEEVKKVDDKKQLSVIFKFYASFGDRTNIDYIRSNKIHKLISDSQILYNRYDQQQIDLLFVKANRNRPNMDFENFYYFLELLSELVIGENSFQVLMDEHLTPLYQNIISSTDLGDEETRLQQEIDELCVRLIQVVMQPIQSIYNKYFPPQFKNFNLKDQQEELMQKQQTRSALYLFLKEFEICPQFITKGSAYLLLDSIQVDQTLPDIIHKKSKSKFCLNRFCCYIIKLAMITFQSYEINNQEQEAISPLQKLAFLFERMELSSGFNNLEIPQSNSKNNWKLKVPEEMIELIVTDPDAIQYLNSSTQRIKINQLKNEEFYDEQVKRINTVPTNRIRPSVQVNKQYEEQVQQLFQENYNQLFNIYRQYAGINQQTGQDNEIVGSKWMKFLKDANLVNLQLYEKNGRSSYLIPHNEIDLIFAKACAIQNRGSVTSNNKSKKQTMNFLQFLKGITMLTTDISQLKIILSEHILNLFSKGPENKMKDFLSQLMCLLKDKEIVDFLGLLHKSVVVYYKFYTIGKPTMNFDQFQRFYKDFSIFPDLLTKNKIVQIFQILSKLYQNQENLTLKGGNIDQHMFVESLALAALEIQYNDDSNLSSLEKIYYLIERINQSDGPRIVQKQLGHTTCPSGADWDMLYHIKKRFSWLLQSEEIQE